MQAEIIALRHQLTVLHGTNPRDSFSIAPIAACGFGCHGRGRVGVIPVIRTMSLENPTWGAPRIHSELMKLNIKISESSVAKYMIRSPKHHLRHGERSSIITFLNSHPSTSSPSTLLGLKSSSFLLSSHMIDDVSYISMSLPTQLLNGRSSKCSKLFLLIRHLDICCEIEIESMGRSSATKSP